MPTPSFIFAQHFPVTTQAQTSTAPSKLSISGTPSSLEAMAYRFMVLFLVK